jgi:methylated-DNA-[protein]-cysteine S-methyltransferase
MSPVPTDLSDALATPDDAVTLDRLRARLAATADDQALLDVAYRTLDSPLGSLLLAATDRGLVRVAFAGEGHDAVLQELADRVSPRVLRAPRRLDAAARELDEYFGHARSAFDLPLDLRLATGFRREVLEQLRGVAYGTTTSYAGLAARTHSPRAVRAVGTACATNPIPLVIPCHRVIRSDGTIGSYRGGAAAKQTLLALEAA